MGRKARRGQTAWLHFVTRSTGGLSYRRGREGDPRAIPVSRTARPAGIGLALHTGAARSRGCCEDRSANSSEGENVVNKVIFVGFDTEQKAYEGRRALHDLHRDGTLTLYNDAVVVKDPAGAVALRQAPGAEPIGTVGGMLTGGLVGLLGGPVGAAVGLGAGTLIGAAFDLTKEGIDKQFVEDAGARLEPGKAAVIAEVDEHWQAPLDARVETLGGTLLRRTRTQIEDAYLERSLETAQRELAALEAEKLGQVTTAEAEKARKQAEKLQAKIDAAKRRLWEREGELAAAMRAVKDEGHRKIAVLEAQKRTAAAESTAVLEDRLANLRREYDGRIKRLQEALDRRRKADAAPTAGK